MLRLPNYFLSCVKDTLNTMTGFKLIESDIENIQRNYDLSGLIILAGKSEVLFAISSNMEQAAILSSYMTGLEVEDLTQNDIIDGFVELVNMAVGMVKTMAENEGDNFKISSPISILGSNINILTKKYVKHYEFCLKADEVELKIQIGFI